MSIPVDKKTVSAFGGVPSFKPDWDRVQLKATIILPPDARDSLAELAREYLIARAAELAAVSIDSILERLDTIQKGAGDTWQAMLIAAPDAGALAGARAAIDSELLLLDHPDAPERAESTEAMISRLTVFIAACQMARRKLDAGRKSAHFGSFNSAWHAFLRGFDKWSETAGISGKWGNSSSMPTPFLLLLDALMKEMPEGWRREYNSILPALGKQVREVRNL
ncbi:hypothetical protein [Mesorhizobium helmanticense]|uniref:Uncharacterized protein n=1 Tax=Mesorhizobium helmanticense TaxID=1776423 RepID=A0A2T4J137_9HYPH|nr:hypothetical protein [Mesorhizobium helmanticense]PTE11548.1 hypothetical protein C9427_04825 [Mesorhizobium helmanticense]